LNIFVNDIWVRLLEPTVKVREEDFNYIINGGKNLITRANLLNHVLLMFPSYKDIDELFKQLDTLLPKSLLSVTVVAKDYEGLKAHIKSRFKIIKAAGGIVRKGQKILMIYRLGKWDLPKGKIEKKELPEKAAVREVKEECGITVKEKKKICNTWHTYTMKKKRIMKKTSWYSLTLLDDSRMAPQQEENIELIQWMGPKEVFHALENSYESIRFVIDIHFKKRNLKWDVE